MRKVIFIVIFAAIILGACSSIECPLNNRAYAVYKLAGDVDTLPAYLTVTTPLSQADGNDSVLINYLSDTDSFSLPMSYVRAEDTFYFFLTDTAGLVLYADTVVVAKDDYPHFESLDCNPTYFHTITGISYTIHAIESIVINNDKVTYNVVNPNFLIYLKDIDY